MKGTYFEEDDILTLRLSYKPVARESSQGWHIHLSYADDGTIVEFVLLDARKVGLMPLEVWRAA